MNQLLTPYAVDGITFKNRVVMPPMCMYKAPNDGTITEFHKAHYNARAIGGVGLIIVEATAVEPKGRISDHDLGLWDDTHIEGHRALVEFAHQHGTKMAVQLAHAGRKSICEASTPVAPSFLLFSEKGGYKIPQELSIDEIEQIKARFVQAGLRAAKAGYDMLELHAAHGYLLCEFLSPLTNQREDMYGGSLENRCALTVQISLALMRTTGLPLCVRLSADEWMDGGWSVEDSLYLASALKEIGVSLIHVSAGGNHEKQQYIPTIKPCYQAPYAKAIYDAVNIPTIAVGFITNASEAESLLENKSCELVAFGRELLRNPNFVAYVAKEYQQREFIDASYLRAF